MSSKQLRLCSRGRWKSWGSRRTSRSLNWAILLRATELRMRVPSSPLKSLLSSLLQKILEATARSCLCKRRWRSFAISTSSTKRPSEENRTTKLPETSSKQSLKMPLITSWSSKRRSIKRTRPLWSSWSSWRMLRLKLKLWSSTLLIWSRELLFIFQSRKIPLTKS